MIPEIRHNGWSLSIDQKSGQPILLKRDGQGVVFSQDFPMFKLAANGKTPYNNRDQLYQTVFPDYYGINGQIVSLSTSENVAIITADWNGIKCIWTWTFDLEHVAVKIQLINHTLDSLRLRWVEWQSNLVSKDELSQFRPLAAGYTPTLLEPFDLERSIAAYRSSSVIAANHEGNAVPAYRSGIMGGSSSQEVRLTWFLSEFFTCHTVSLGRTDTGFVRQCRVYCPHWLSQGESLTISGFRFSVMRGDRVSAIRQAAMTFRQMGWWRPRKAEYRDLRIYELHIGEKSWRNTLASYEAFLPKLPVLKELGFNTLQIMPAFPFPNYSVFDMMDLDTTYGNSEQLRQLIHSAHVLGFRVLLDIVLHGPLDYDENVVHRRVSPYITSHEAWFMRDEYGQYARTYTRSLDLANPAYQEHIANAMIAAVDQLGADGFRLDAQMWSEFANWDSRTNRQPYESLLAGLRMMQDVSQRVRDRFPDVFFYTEANGPMTVRDHELRYNYDLHWLYPALAPVTDRRGAAPGIFSLISNNTLSWPQAAAWLTEAAVSRPPGMTVVNHVDSHDSHEWLGAQGGQFNREAYGDDMHRPLLTLSLFMDGAFMSFLGAEEGHEDFYRSLLNIKGHDILMHGECSYTSVRADDPKTACIIWELEEQWILFAGNLEAREKQVRLSFPENDINIIHSCLLKSPVHASYSSGSSKSNSAEEVVIELPPCAVLILKGSRGSCRE